MALTPLQNAQNAWQRRAAQFRSQGIPDAMWTQLYNRDLEGVYSGSQGMSDAEVYAGVQAAVKGPGGAISDPTPQHGHGGGIGGIFTGIANTIGNIPKDVGGIITGFPAGIAHLVAHLPSEVTNTGELLYHLADGDNSWLQSKGYLGPGEQLHESWGDFATILRAMDRNGSKQLLPYLPFLADAANMTSGQGRAALMQHPVGAFLDVLPGIAKAGKVVMSGKDLAAVGVDGTPKFWAAGKSLQEGNPVKAAVSAVGDLIPAGRDDFGAAMTLRERANLAAKAVGIDRMTREGILRPLQNARTELGARTNKYMQDSFGDKMWRQLTPDRALYLYKGSHYVNPDTGKVFESEQEFNTWRETKLSPEENAGIDTARTIAAAQEARGLAEGRLGKVPHAGFEEVVPTASAVFQHYKAALHWGTLARSALEKFEEAVQNGHELNMIKYIRLVNKHMAAYDKAFARFGKAQLEQTPERWNLPITTKIKDLATQHAKEIYSGGELERALDTIKKSQWGKDYSRLFGADQYKSFVNDALQWWHRMAAEGANPLWTVHVDPTVYDHILEPSLGRLDAPLRPGRYDAKNMGLYFGDTVFDIAVSLTNSQMEVLREEFVTNFLKTHVIPRTLSKAATYKKYADAVEMAKVKAGHTMPSPATLMKQNFDDFNPKTFGLRKTAFKKELGEERLIDKDLSKAIQKVMSPAETKQWGGKWFMRGTSVYKFSVLTGPRHFAHISLGGLTMMMLREPLAPLMFLRAYKILHGTASAEDHGLAGLMMSGLKQEIYQIGPHHTWNDHGIGPYHGWNHQAGVMYGDGLQVDLLHQAKQAGVKAAEFIPNKLARMEETIISMYKVATYLSAKEIRGLDREAALETAHKVFVDINGMSLMERTAIKQVFPFYAFTRHLFRYLFSYPVDYPMRAAIVSQFGEGEQADWASGLPRDYMTLLWLGQPNAQGNISAIDLKNANPFRSFANDFSFAGFFSSLSPWLTGPLAAIGVDTLSGTTQLYPGTTYNPTTGSLQATPPPGGGISLIESFVPQVGLLDHYFQLTQSTRLLAKYSPRSYRKQIYNMLNVPFVPEVINVPYQQEITEMRRFRAAQAAVSTVSKNPSPANVAKLMEWNAVPFNNELISPAVLAAYYQQVEQALSAAGRGYIAPKAVLKTPPRKPAQIGNF